MAIGAVDRRLQRMRLEDSPWAGQTAPGMGSPFSDAPISPSPGMGSSLDADLLQGARAYYAPETGRFISAPDASMDEAQGLAQWMGTIAGKDAVSRRLEGQASSGLGRYIDPATGQSASFGTGRFLTNPASFFASTPEDDLNTRARDIKDAVARKLQELTGGGSTPFASPQPRRGRFGT